MSVDESLRAEQYRDASNLNARIALHERFSTNPHPLPLWIFDQLELPDDARILRPGGHLYAATNGIKHMHELVAMLRVLDPEWSHESINTDLANFNLQNGAEQLSAWFKEVALLGYEDSLTVTQTKPLVDYLLSTMHGQELAKRLSAEEFRRRLSTLKDSLAKELAARGSIPITKDTGMFVASCSPTIA